LRKEETSSQDENETSAPEPWAETPPAGRDGIAGDGVGEATPFPALAQPAANREIERRRTNAKYLVFKAIVNHHQFGFIELQWRGGIKSAFFLQEKN